VVQRHFAQTLTGHTWGVVALWFGWETDQLPHVSIWIPFVGARDNRIKTSVLTGWPP